MTRSLRLRKSRFWNAEPIASDLNYVEIDAIVGVDGHYVACFIPTRISTEFECDIDVAKAAIVSALNTASEHRATSKLN